MIDDFVRRGKINERTMDARFYEEIKGILEGARNQVYATANSAMVQAYWNIGKSISEQQGKSERAEYGTQLIQKLSKQLTRDFGKGFTAANLRNMRQFYMTFPNRYALRSTLSWTHYRLLMRVEDEQARTIYDDTLRRQMANIIICNERIPIPDETPG